jgi:hypothetical protein
VRREAADHPEQLLHGGAAADHAGKLEPAGDVPLEREQASALVDLLGHRRQQLLEPAKVERFAQVVHRAQLDRFDGGVDRGVAGHQDGLAMRIGLTDRPQDVKTTDVGHPQIDHQQVGAPGLHLGDRFAAARTRHHVKTRAPCEAAHDVEDALFVVDDDE